MRLRREGRGGVGGRGREGRTLQSVDDGGAAEDGVGWALGLGEADGGGGGKDEGEELGHFCEQGK
jgi:hypothetical protein